MRTSFFVIPFAIATLSLTGCLIPLSPISTPETPVQQTAETPLQVYLAKSPTCEPVACSIKPSVSATAVTRFNQLSEEVSTLYTTVYQEVALTTDNGTQKTLLDTFCTQAHDYMSTNAVPWETAIETVLTSHYQQLLERIANERKAVSTFAASIRDDAAIAAITSKSKQTPAIVALSTDALKLQKQLNAAEEGASLILKDRFSQLVAPQK